MKDAIRWAPFAGLCVVGILGLWVVPARASHEAFAVYEDWRTARTIRSDRWIAFEGGNAQEVRLEIRGHHLLMRHRREGLTTSNVNFVGVVQGLQARNPAAIDQIEADFHVRNMAVSGCAANPGQTLVRPALLALSAFNDGTPDGQTGDHYIQVQVNGEPDLSDPPGVLTVQANIVRCLNPTCSLGTSPVFNLAVAMIPVQEPFTLRAIWDRPNHRFLVGVNDKDIEFRVDGRNFAIVTKHRLIRQVIHSHAAPLHACENHRAHQR